jgi:hypothetical protein
MWLQLSAVTDIRFFICHYSCPLLTGVILQFPSVPGW